jgi:dihydroorotate dehydrogenase
VSSTNESSQAGGLARYDSTKSYRWNFDHAPRQTARALTSDIAVPGQWNFLGLPVASPLGVAAGPLLNGDWCLHYAALGFDVLTYKTVRSGQRDCYPLPNLQPVRCDRMTDAQSRVAPCEAMHGSWAVSFGMPSSSPEKWRSDIERTRKQLSADKVLSVSVVGTIQPEWDLPRLAEDYAICARWAVESGADCIEANFSCPNVATCDGQLYQDADQSCLVATVIRDAIRSTPLIIKIGFVPPNLSPRPLVTALSGIADALSMTNSISAKVGISDGPLMFDGQPRGICGAAIRDSSIDQIRRFADEIAGLKSPLKLIGVGGISAAAHVQSYLRAGAHACHLATSVMVDPSVGLRIRGGLKQFASLDQLAGR